MKIGLRGPHLDDEPARLINRVSGARTAQFGAAALGVVLLGGSLLGGAAGRAGLANSSSQTWIEDGPRGQLVEINTASGQAQQRLNVSAPGDVLEVHQRSQDLIVQDRTTGALRTIDLTTLLAEGERQVRPGSDTQVILDGPRVALAQLSTGVIQGIDPVSSASIGAAYSIGAPLAAAVADTSGHVWGLATTGRLDELVWSGAGYRLRDSLQVKGAGPGSGLSAHSSGVTVMVTPTGSVEDADDGATGTTDVRAATQLGSPVLITPSTPPGVVPAAARGTSVVVIATPTGVVQPDLAAVGCAHPLAPVVFDNRIYVPCDGSPEVVVLKPDGSPAGAPIAVPSGRTPELTVAGGTLVVNVPGATSVVLVNPKGVASAVGTEPPGIPTTSQSDPAPVPSPSTPPTPPASHPKASNSAKPADTPQVAVTLSPSTPVDGSISIGVTWSVSHAASDAKFLVTVAVAGGTSQTLQISNSSTRSAVVTVACSTSCSGTAGVSVVGGSGPGSSASRPWTSVAPVAAGSGPGGSGGGTGASGGGKHGGTGGAGRGGGTVVGPSTSPTPSGVTGLPTVPIVPVGPPTPAAPADSSAPAASASPTPRVSPTPSPVRSTAKPIPTQPSVAPPTSAAPAPPPTSAAPAPAPTSAAPAPAPTSASPAPPPAPAAPAAGETVITLARAALRGASVTLTITEPADWAASGAACAVMNDGDDGASGTFTCDSTTTFTERETTGPEDSEDYYIRATMPGGAISDSAHYTITTPSACTGTACQCNTSLIAANGSVQTAFAVEPARTQVEDGDMPNQIAPCP